MKSRSFLLAMSLLAPVFAAAQSTNANANAGNNGQAAKVDVVPTASAPITKAGTLPGTDDADRLMQEYMARREEWMAVRKIATEKAEKATNENARKAILKQLETDEKATLTKMDEAAKAYRDVKKQKNANRKPRG